VQTRTDNSDTDGSDLDCSDMSGPVYVGPDDPNRLDADGDGIGCE
jgi:micrococcal nuclease